MIKTFTFLRHFLYNRAGNVAMLGALLIPVVIFAAGGAIDYLRWAGQRSDLKQLSDTLATRGAREFLLANATEQNIKAVIQAAINNDVAANAGLGELKHETIVDMANTTVTVSLTQPPKPGVLLTNFVPYSDTLVISSTAVARGGSSICVVTLDEKEEGAFNAEMNSSLQADECSVLSNSIHSKGMIVSQAARVSAELICSAGGYGGNFINYSPSPTTDCPIYEDPLKARIPPSFAGCDHTDMELGSPTIVTSTLSTVVNIADGAPVGGLTRGLGLKEISHTEYTLEPGVYCGGLNIGSDADVTLESGIYIMKDGPLAVALGGRLHGEGVSFYLTGSNAVFYFGGQSLVELSASQTGELAGILFFEDRAAPEGRLHQILSGNARELIGTFYLPKGTLRVASLVPVADNSAYTALVVNRLSLAGSPTLVLNSDYTSTDVPVPDGVGPIGGTTYLRE